MFSTDRIIYISDLKNNLLWVNNIKNKFNICDLLENEQLNIKNKPDDINEFWLWAKYAIVKLFQKKIIVDDEIIFKIQNIIENKSEIPDDVKSFIENEEMSKKIKNVMDNTTKDEINEFEKINDNEILKLLYDSEKKNE